MQPKALGLNGRKFLLFTTKTCPNCLIIKTWMDGQGVEYEALLAEENRELTRKFGVMLAPTAIILSEDGTYEKFVGVSEIKTFVEGNILKQA
ncbi:MAG: ribonucleoside triphosphate reductase, partial [Bacillota bacterium]|nr:ribonucleoside triphosphate reductase [Bacillota bacterium]